jgi:F-type H+-transporting ATPase subunit b
MKGRASEESAAALQKADEDLKQQSDAIQSDLRSSMETLGSTLASRVLGVDVGRDAGTKSRR